MEIHQEIPRSGHPEFDPVLQTIDSEFEHRVRNSFVPMMGFFNRQEKKLAEGQNITKYNPDFFDELQQNLLVNLREITSGIRSGILQPNERINTESLTNLIEAITSMDLTNRADYQKIEIQISKILPPSPGPSKEDHIRV